MFREFGGKEGSLGSKRLGVGVLVPDFGVEGGVCCGR